MSEIAYIAFGSNQGDRERDIARAIEELRAIPGTRVLRVSSVFETKPVDCPPGSKDFLNGAVEIETELRPQALLSALLSIEHELGRVRSEKNASRPIDLDILLYGDEVVNEPDLVIPHPRMHERAFILDPLLELAPDIRDPRSGEAFAAIADRLPHA